MVPAGAPAGAFFYSDYMEEREKPQRALFEMHNKS